MSRRRSQSPPSRAAPAARRSQSTAVLGADSEAPSYPTLTSIQRFAVKGLSSDRLPFASLVPQAGLPNDRRFAFIFARAVPLLKENQWLHKQNFVSAFASSKTVAGLLSSFDDATSALCVWRRTKKGRGALLLKADLSRLEGRDSASAFFSDAIGEHVELVDGADTHQFGNTNQGVKASGELRTLHIVNANTVRALERVAGVPIDPRRFRPNLVIDGIPAWEEFEWVDTAEVRVGTSAKLRIIGRTVRCSGVHRSAEVQPGHGGAGDDGGELDIVHCLSSHFPEHGPYLGVYAQTVEGGEIAVGDRLEVCPRRAASRRHGESVAKYAIAFIVLALLWHAIMWSRK